MEACLAVEKEIDRVLSKFGNINENMGRILSDLIQHIQDLKAELESGKYCQNCQLMVLLWSGPRRWAYFDIIIII